MRNPYLTRASTNGWSLRVPAEDPLDLVEFLPRPGHKGWQDFGGPWLVFGRLFHQRTWCSGELSVVSCQWSVRVRRPVRRVPAELGGHAVWGGAGRFSGGPEWKSPPLPPGEGQGAEERRGLPEPIDCNPAAEFVEGPFWNAAKGHALNPPPLGVSRENYPSRGSTATG